MDGLFCRLCHLDRILLGKIRIGFCGRASWSIVVQGGRSLCRNVDMGEVWNWGRCVGIDIHLDRVLAKQTSKSRVADVPPFEQYPFLTKKLHSGIFLRLYSCRNSQCSPFLHSPLNQCLQTRLLKLELLLGATWRSGQVDPSGQCPWR